MGDIGTSSLVTTSRANSPRSKVARINVMSELPSDIAMDFLEFLPRDSLSKLQAVSKSLNDFIRRYLWRNGALEVADASLVYFQRNFIITVGGADAAEAVDALDVADAMSTINPSHAIPHYEKMSRLKYLRFTKTVFHIRDEFDGNFREFGMLINPLR